MIRTAKMWKPSDQPFTPAEFESIAGELGVLPNRCTWRTWQEYGDDAVKGNVWEAVFAPIAEPTGIREIIGL